MTQAFDDPLGRNATKLGFMMGMGGFVCLLGAFVQQRNIARMR